VIFRVGQSTQQGNLFSGRSPWRGEEREPHYTRGCMLQAPTFREAKETRSAGANQCDAPHVIGARVSGTLRMSPLVVVMAQGIYAPATTRRLDQLLPSVTRAGISANCPVATARGSSGLGAARGAGREENLRSCEPR
jgi:hypothetical protein